MKSISSAEGIINLIPKKEKDSRYLKNLRPITLLNSDYKVIEKALANRMVPEMEKIIHPDQKGFLPNRRISINIRKAFDILKNVENTEAVYMSHSDDSVPGGPIFRAVPYNYFGGKPYALCENLLPGNTPY